MSLNPNPTYMQPNITIPQFILNEIINSTINPLIPGSSNHTSNNHDNLKPINTNENFHNKEEAHSSGHSAHEFLSAKTLIAIVILVVHTISAPIFEKLHFHYLHESGISMLLGMIVGLVALVINPTVN